MPKEIISKEQRNREARALRAILESERVKAAGINQYTLADDMNVSQGLINQWVTARSPIPAKRLIWLSKRLGFDATEVRPNLDDESKAAVENEMNKIIIEVMNRDPQARTYIEALIKASPVYEQYLARRNAIDPTP